MLNRIAFVGFVAFLAFVAGCGSPEAKEDAADAGRVVITSENMERIVGMQWILRQMRVDGADFALSGEMPFIRFGSEGGISGFGSVNRYFGSVSIDAEGKLRWSKGLGATRMAGPPEAMKQEQAYFKGLPKIEEFSVEGINLYGQSADGETQFVFYVPVK